VGSVPDVELNGIENRANTNFIEWILLWQVFPIIDLANNHAL
jgi:hypothetical protein